MTTAKGKRHPYGAHLLNLISTLHLPPCPLLLTYQFSLCIVTDDVSTSSRDQRNKNNKAFKYAYQIFHYVISFITNLQWTKKICSKLSLISSSNHQITCIPFSNRVLTHRWNCQFILLIFLSCMYSFTPFLVIYLRVITCRRKILAV